MKLEQFQTKLQMGNTAVVPVNIQNADLFDDILRIKGIFKYIDFDCQINNTPRTKSGRCKRALCCCSNCSSSNGYLRIIPKELLKKYARHFSVETGYWRKGKGCILNHTMRSTTCLCYNCNQDDKQFSSSISQLKSILNNMELEIIKPWRAKQC